MQETLQQVMNATPREQAKMIEQLEAEIDPYYIAWARNFLSL